MVEYLLEKDGASEEVIERHIISLLQVFLLDSLDMDGNAPLHLAAFQKHSQVNRTPSLYYSVLTIGGQASPG